MNAFATGLAPVPNLFVTDNLTRSESYARSHVFDRPTLVFDLDAMSRRYAALEAGLAGARIHYAVKANPAEPVIARLLQHGSAFDAASRPEIELCLSLGAAPSRISFGNTIKRPADIAFAHAKGITLFAADAPEELEKIAAHAPGAEVYIRLMVTQSQADWPLSRKFGCYTDAALPLLAYAQSLGLKPVGFSFHVGSQTRCPQMWSPILREFAAVWVAAREAGFALDMLNIGGGFPASYLEPIIEPEPYAGSVMAEIRTLFPGATRIMAEPGRGLVAEAGVIAAEVVLVTRRGAQDLHRWVYLDIGRFSGLAETEDEAIRYDIATEHQAGPTGPCVVAGPSCDSADVLYEKRPLELPLALTSGDRVFIRATGAYTTTYASVGFNGFPPLDAIYI